jgi:hypothetical protein
MCFVYCLYMTGPYLFDYIKRLIQLTVIPLSGGHCIDFFPHEGLNSARGMANTYYFRKKHQYRYHFSKKVSNQFLVRPRGQERKNVIKYFFFNDLFPLTSFYNNNVCSKINLQLSNDIKKWVGG